MWNADAVKELMDHMVKTGLDGLSLEDGDFKLTLTAPARPIPASPAIPQGAPAVPAAPVSQPEAASAAPVGDVVKSPIVGTFYAAASPDKPPFAQVGSRVKKGDTLFIIESMKLMNEIQSEYTGEVVEILAENGQAVEYGQPIMIIRSV